MLSNLMAIIAILAAIYSLLQAHNLNMDVRRIEKEKAKLGDWLNELEGKVLELKYPSTGKGGTGGHTGQESVDQTNALNQNAALADKHYMDACRNMVNSNRGEAMKRPEGTLASEKYHQAQDAKNQQATDELKRVENIKQNLVTALVTAGIPPFIARMYVRDLGQTPPFANYEKTATSTEPEGKTRQDAIDAEPFKGLDFSKIQSSADITIFASDGHTVVDRYKLEPSDYSSPGVVDLSKVLSRHAKKETKEYTVKPEGDEKLTERTRINRIIDKFRHLLDVPDKRILSELTNVINDTSLSNDEMRIKFCNYIDSRRATHEDSAVKASDVIEYYTALIQRQEIAIRTLIKTNENVVKSMNKAVAAIAPKEDVQETPSKPRKTK